MPQAGALKVEEGVIECTFSNRAMYFLLFPQNHVTSLNSEENILLVPKLCLLSRYQTLTCL